GGTAFRMSSDGTVTTLHAFSVPFTSSDAHEGSGPSSLILGADGNFYGTTACGNHGVFRMTPAGQVTLLSPTDGMCGSEIDDPVATVIQGRNGHLYVTSFNSIFALALDGTKTV